VHRTTISTTLAAEKEKEPIVLPLKLSDFADVFKKPEVPLPPHRPFNHTIKLNDSFVPRRAKNYSLNSKEMEALKVFIDENLKEGKILPSKSPQVSPFFFVPKKDGTFRPCQDYCYVNSHTIKNACPLPHISDLVDTLKHSHYFTKLNIRWGYNNIWIKETNQWKAAFTTPYGLYEPTVMFFGQCNSPPTFQAFMNHIFADYLVEGWLIIYMDDLMVYSVDLEEHISRVHLVLQCLREHKLGVKLEKCIFCAPQAKYLGLIVGEGQILMDPVKLTAINDWKSPTSVSAVRSFMGFCNFY